MRRHTNGHPIASCKQRARQRRRRFEDERQRARPQRAHDWEHRRRQRAQVSLDPIQVCGNERDRLRGVTALDVEHAVRRGGVPRVGRQPVQRVRWIRDDAAGP